MDKIDKQLELLDTPGILWPKLDDEAIGMKLACVGSISDEVLNMQEAAHFFLDLYADCCKVQSAPLRCNFEVPA